MVNLVFCTKNSLLPTSSKGGGGFGCISSSSFGGGWEEALACTMLYGEEYSITLPTIDATNEPFNIGFKTNNTDEQQPWVTLSPNPAKDAVQIQHHLADNQTGKFCLYSPDGQLLHSATLVGNGNYVLSTQNMASGVYFYTLEQNGQTLQRNKIVIIK